MENRPILFTLKQFKKPIDRAKQKLLEIRDLGKKQNLTDIILQGLFILAISSFEYMITDTLTYYLKNFPEKLDNKEVKLTKEELLSNDIIELHISKVVNSLLYKKIVDILDYYFEVLSIKSIPNEDDLIYMIVEVKETRNLLLHNDLIVNRVYLEKAGKFKRSERIGEKLKIDTKYFLNSIDSIISLIDKIEEQVSFKYSGYTEIAALRSLWEYLFNSPVMNFDDYWILDEKNDKIIASKKGKYESGISNSERMFLGIWRAHFNGNTKYLDHFNMRSLDNKRKKQMLYFLSIADEIEFY